MAYYLPADNATDGDGIGEIAVQDEPRRQCMADLKIFWGPDICRLEYLLHLLNTGRIKDEHATQHMS
jgi:hypothetical protein